MPADLVRRVLGPFVVDPSSDRWELAFPDGSGGDMMPVTDEPSPGLCIDHYHGAGLLNAIYEIMRQTHSIMWWSGGPDVITADEHIADHLPSGFIEQLGPPALVRSGADILAEIAKT